MRAALEEKEAALSQLAAANGGDAPRAQGLRAELEVAQREATERGRLAETLREEMAAERHSKEELLVRQRLDAAAASTREREHSQQLDTALSRPSP